MITVSNVLIRLFLFLLLLSPRDSHSGYASAYAPGVMEATVRYRLDYDVWRTPLPHDWYTVHGYAAVMDCSRVGEIAVLTVYERDYRVLIADCAGDDGTVEWATKNRIVVELDWRLWERLTDRHGRPLPVGLGD